MNLPLYPHRTPLLATVHASRGKHLYQRPHDLFDRLGCNLVAGHDVGSVFIPFHGAA